MAALSWTELNRLTAASELQREIIRTFRAAVERLRELQDRNGLVWLVGDGEPYSVHELALLQTIGWLREFALGAQSGILSTYQVSSGFIMESEEETNPYITANLSIPKLATSTREDFNVSMERELAELDAVIPTTKRNLTNLGFSPN